MRFFGLMNDGLELGGAGSIPGVKSDEMKLVIKLAVPRRVQHLLDIEKVKSVFP